MNPEEVLRMFLFVVLLACLAYGLSLHVGGQIGGKRSIDMPPNQEVNDAAAVSYENGNVCVVSRLFRR